MSRESAFFKQAFNGAFRESSSGVLELPEDDPKVFEMMVRWVYGRVFAITTVVLKQPDADFTIRNYFELYVIASKFLMTDLQDCITTVAYEYFTLKDDISPRGETRCPSVADARYIYDSTPSESNMRALLADNFATDLFRGGSSHASEWSQLLGSSGDIGSDILARVASWKLKHNYCIPRLSLEAKCAYHAHKSGQVCPQ